MKFDGGLVVVDLTRALDWSVVVARGSMDKLIFSSCVRICMRMIFLWEKSLRLVRCTTGYGNERLLTVNVLIVSRVVNHGIECASIPCVLFTFEYTLRTLRTKEKGHRTNSSVE